MSVGTVAKAAPFVLDMVMDQIGDNKKGVNTALSLNDRVTIDGEKPINWAVGRMLSGPTT